MAEPAVTKDKFIIDHADFELREQVNYPNGGISKFYDNGMDMVIIDEDICDCKKNEDVFSYMLITDKQNNYMHRFNRVFRFLGYSQEEVDRYLLSEEIMADVEYTISVGDREEQVDASPLEERDYSLSYKMSFMLSFIDTVNAIGDADIEKVLDGYIAFYQNRIDRGLLVDRSACPYNEKTLKDRKVISRNMLTNPFEKFERKRFLYYSKDLSVISMNHALYSQMTEEDWTRVKDQLEEDLKNYYAEMGGI